LQVDLYRASVHATPLKGERRMVEYLNEHHREIFATTSSIAGWQEPGDSEALFEMGYTAGDVILEIGTYAGRSAVCMIAGALSAGRRPRYYGVDISSRAVAMTCATLAKHSYLARTLLYTGTLQAFIERYRIQPSSVFVDGGHDYKDVSADLAALSKILAPGTPVIFHDYLNSDTPGVAAAIHEARDDGKLEIRATSGCSALTRWRSEPQRRYRRPGATRFACHQITNGADNIYKLSRQLAKRVFQ
jgi:hypothetical protein